MGSLRPFFIFFTMDSVHMDTSESRQKK